MIKSIINEIEIRAKTWKYKNIETIYFGGGTPSVLEIIEIETILNSIMKRFNCASIKEITLEANPEDINELQIKNWKKLGVNRLSIGVQSINNEELQWMNRIHTAEESKNCIKLSQDNGIDNLSIDLIYGGPKKSNEQWNEELTWFQRSGIKHLSAYGLTEEPKTLFAKQIAVDKSLSINMEKQSWQYEHLYAIAKNENWDFYEISNLSIGNNRAIHNSNYWNRLPYLGIGPGAHGFADNTRYWNITNNSLYIKSLLDSKLYNTEENLSKIDELNEYLLVKLRLEDGICYNEIPFIQTKTNQKLLNQFNTLIKNNFAIETANGLKLSLLGRHFADKISSDLMIV